jgi:hypothetical protein
LEQPHERRAFYDTLLSTSLISRAWRWQSGSCCALTPISAMKGQRGIGWKARSQRGGGLGRSSGGLYRRENSSRASFKLAWFTEPLHSRSIRRLDGCLGLEPGQPRCPLFRKVRDSHSFAPTGIIELHLIGLSFTPSSLETISPRFPFSVVRLELYKPDLPVLGPLFSSSRGKLTDFTFGGHKDERHPLSRGHSFSTSPSSLPPSPVSTSSHTSHQSTTSSPCSQHFATSSTLMSRHSTHILFGFSSRPSRRVLNDSRSTLTTEFNSGSTWLSQRWRTSRCWVSLLSSSAARRMT